jgi:hypothetical protein
VLEVVDWFNITVVHLPKHFRFSETFSMFLFMISFRRCILMKSG